MEYIKVRVKANSDVNEIVKHRDHYEVKVKAKPKNGDANLAVIKLINKKFKMKAKIISGLRSKEKLIMLV